MVGRPGGVGGASLTAPIRVVPGSYGGDTNEMIPMIHRGTAEVGTVTNWQATAAALGLPIRLVAAGPAVYPEVPLVAVPEPAAAVPPAATCAVTIVWSACSENHTISPS